MTARCGTTATITIVTFRRTRSRVQFAYDSAPTRWFVEIPHSRTTRSTARKIDRLQFDHLLSLRSSCDRQEKERITTKEGFACARVPHRTRSIRAARPEGGWARPTLTSSIIKVFGVKISMVHRRCVKGGDAQRAARFQKTCRCLPPSPRGEISFSPKKILVQRILIAPIKTNSRAGFSSSRQTTFIVGDLLKFRSYVDSLREYVVARATANYVARRLRATRRSNPS